MDDIDKGALRRRIEDYLRKYATIDQLVKIARFLNVPIPPPPPLE